MDQNWEISNSRFSFTFLLKDGLRLSSELSLGPTGLRLASGLPCQSEFKGLYHGSGVGLVHISQLYFWSEVENSVLGLKTTILLGATLDSCRLEAGHRDLCIAIIFLKHTYFNTHLCFCERARVLCELFEHYRTGDRRSYMTWPVWSQFVTDHNSWPWLVQNDLCHSDWWIRQR
mgnify:CR=1 FL=1